MPDVNRPNILLLVSDQERQRDWLPPGLSLPARQSLLSRSLEFRRHYTHTSPCSPSRATLFTGLHMDAHGVTENSSYPSNTQLSTRIPTLGTRLREAGYRTAYKGKWHLQATAEPDMEAYGFSDWVGNDMAFWGLPGSGTEFDEPIAADAAGWLRNQRSASQPWFLTVGLVNPHDIMWFPLDQPWFWNREPEYVAESRARLDRRKWGRATNLPAFGHEIERWFTELPENFDDDLHTKPEVHRRWMLEMERNSRPGRMDPDDHDSWLRQLDYYVKLHQLSDQSLAMILDAMDDINQWDRTVVVFTSDHGDQCGSHGLRSKGPWNYEETLRIPLYISAPGRTTSASTTEALSCHTDLAVTILELAGVDASDLPGRSLLPLFGNQEAKIRDYVLFAQRWPWYMGVEKVRYASSGVFDGHNKYCRYYGIGGGVSNLGVSLGDSMLFGPGASFEDHEHEWYDHDDDPHELVNLANDRSRRVEVRERFQLLKELEAAEYGN
ncbi:sulfatase-like hydrolase/transferase [Candidatus Poriferisocius sp.]|uniref:sulfatase-like hydrolase/transferase n=1 Tax=Candidatus Poriferisocius sp. TaxID=3101276 RepID=UPI003B0102FB